MAPPNSRFSILDFQFPRSRWAFAVGAAAGLAIGDAPDILQEGAVANVRLRSTERLSGREEDVRLANVARGIELHAGPTPLDEIDRQEIKAQPAHLDNRPGTQAFSSST